jgi:tRNA 2-selenouridine synthase
MIATTTDLSRSHRNSFCELIDARSPTEFVHDHIPGAINLPVLTDEQRVEVGTTYKQINPFVARKRGAAYVSTNIAHHLHHHLADKPGGYQPLLYCWRGGMRSNSFATVLAAIGWRVTIVEGGYKTYREWVRQQLETVANGFTLHILAGPTGSGKTRLLRHIADREQVLDLEQLANHRGSAIGSEPNSPQPSQAWFESQLLEAFARFDPSRPVWVESESRRIGNLFLPTNLWELMRRSAGVEVDLPLAERVQHLKHEYQHFLDSPELLESKLRHLSGQQNPHLSAWQTLLAARDWDALAAALLVQHYDSRYRHSLQQYFPLVTERRPLANTTDGELARFWESLAVSRRIA